MLTFKYKSFSISIALLLILIFIALFVNDSFIRPFLGDSIAVIWLFYTFDSVIKISRYWLLFIVLLISYCLEFIQYLKILSLLGLEDIRVLKVVFGSTFDIKDILAYTLGALVVLLLIRRK